MSLSTPFTREGIATPLLLPLEKPPGSADVEEESRLTAAMYSAFKNISTRESAEYSALCMVQGNGIQCMDNHMPEKNKTRANGVAWSEGDTRITGATKTSS